MHTASLFCSLNRRSSSGALKGFTLKSNKKPPSPLLLLLSPQISIELVRISGNNPCAMLGRARDGTITMQQALTPSVSVFLKPTVLAQTRLCQQETARRGCSQPSRLTVETSSPTYPLCCTDLSVHTQPSMQRTPLERRTFEAGAQMCSCLLDVLMLMCIIANMHMLTRVQR